VQPHRKDLNRVGKEDNPFETSDEEDASNDNELLFHLVKDLTDIDFDYLDLTTSICDHKAFERKSNFCPKRAKLVNGLINNIKVFHHERILLE